MFDPGNTCDIDTSDPTKVYIQNYKIGNLNIKSEPEADLTNTSELTAKPKVNC